ncbi:AAA family ATPase [Massilia sp. WF1]|uniref:AAA family ATPase n=2 Tax=unclassified Massilia TaxID=2609279 RepID=UPI000A5AAA8C|nr:AAA family ATPase [Massilia sp. WF1]
MMGAIARGHSWRGITVKQRRVVYIVAEGVKGFRARLRAYSQRHGIDLDTVPFVVVTEPPNLLQQDDKALAASVKAWGGADIIIFDTLAQSTPGANENTSEGIGKALAHCKRLHRVTGAMIVLVAHTGKDASKGVRGWSGIRGAADVQIEVVCHGDQRAIKIDKQKDGKDGNEFGFRLEEVVIGQNDDGDDVTSCVVEHLMTMPVAARKKEPQSRNQALILRIASELLRSGKGPVSERDLIEACVSQMPRKESAGCDNRRRDLARAFMGLVAANLIDTRAGHVELK